MDMNPPLPVFTRNTHRYTYPWVFFSQDYICGSWKLFERAKILNILKYFKYFSQNQHLRNLKNTANMIRAVFLFHRMISITYEEWFRSQFLSGLKIKLWLSTTQWIYIKANLNGSGEWETLHVPGILMWRNFWLLLKPVLYIPPLCLKTLNLVFSIFNLFFSSFLKIC